MTAYDETIAALRQLAARAGTLENVLFCAPRPGPSRPVAGSPVLLGFSVITGTRMTPDAVPSGYVR